MSILHNPSARNRQVITDRAMKKQLQLTAVVRTLVRFNRLLSRRPIHPRKGVP